jgi:hypothetical protein
VRDRAGFEAAFRGFTGASPRDFRAAAAAA